jgi:hypothetical protein
VSEQFWMQDNCRECERLEKVLDKANARGDGLDQLYASSVREIERQAQRADRAEARVAELEALCKDAQWLVHWGRCMPQVPEARRAEWESRAHRFLCDENVKAAGRGDEIGAAVL